MANWKNLYDDTGKLITWSATASFSSNKATVSLQYDLSRTTETETTVRFIISYTDTEVYHLYYDTSNTNSALTLTKAESFNDIHGTGGSYKYSGEVVLTKLKSALSFVIKKSILYFTETVGSSSMFNRAALSEKSFTIIIPEPLKLECDVDFDNIWLQDNCHWAYDSSFSFTWSISGGNIFDSVGTFIKQGAVLDRIDTYYRTGPYVEVPYGQVMKDYGYRSIAAIASQTKEKVTTYQGLTENLNKIAFRKTTTYSSVIDISELLNKNKQELVDNKCITICCKAIDTDGKAYLTYKELPVYLSFPPTEIAEEDIEVKKISSKKIICSWKNYNKTSDVEGYGIEMRYRAEGDVGFTRIKNLGVVADGEGVHKLIKTSYLLNANLAAPEVGADEEPIVTYANQDHGLEAFISGADSTSFYFDPTEFGIKNKDILRITIYPYNAYSITDSLITKSGTTYTSEALNAGIVRVKTAGGWKEGQVWVKTVSGWKEATGVYTKTSAGWKESI